ncbi:hypothetical protein UPYG_G00303840 [Umbra pygmaea]|uniref:Uncharacterized protein n=1 Tax=Umbra pygmaea TaxID=75934 RepID=A0ABD0WTP0_UMBPY
MASEHPMDSVSLLGINVVVKDEEGEMVDYLGDPIGLSWGVKQEPEEVPCHLGENSGSTDQAKTASESFQENQQRHNTPETKYPCLACGKRIHITVDTETRDHLSPSNSSDHYTRPIDDSPEDLSEDTEVDLLKDGH